MKICNIRAAIENAVSRCLKEIRMPGIVSAEPIKVAVSSDQLQWVAGQLEQQGCCEIKLTAKILLLLHINNNDALRTFQKCNFLIEFDADQNTLRAVATTEENWASAWERGISPLRESLLNDIRRDIRAIDDTLTEDSSTFQAAMVLYASEVVGPYVGRVATFVGYPRSVVQLIGDRLMRAEIWRSDTVHYEPWSGEEGRLIFLLDLSVAEGDLLRAWSDERQDYVYSANPSEQTLSPSVSSSSSARIV